MVALKSTMRPVAASPEYLGMLLPYLLRRERISRICFCSAACAALFAFAARLRAFAFAASSADCTIGVRPCATRHAFTCSRFISVLLVKKHIAHIIVGNKLHASNAFSPHVRHVPYATVRAPKESHENLEVFSLLPCLTHLLRGIVLATVGR